MSIIGTVRELWRYPVKSLQGERLASCTLSSRGLAGDRAWAIYGADGKIGSGKNTRRFRAMARLLDLHATLTGDEVIIDLPDGPCVSGPSPAADAALSRWIGEAVTLRAEGAIRHHDAKPVHLLSTTALTWLGRTLGDGTVPDPRRFRANLVMDLVGDHERPEETLVNRRLAIGGTVLRVTERSARCVMVGTAQRALPVDNRVLRTLAQDNQACLGVYAEVETGGMIRRGDEIHLGVTT